MTTTLLIRHVRIRTFRNLTAVDLDPAPRVNVLAGDNGQGKTSVLEALYFVATSRSFRTDRLAEVVQEGATATSVRLEILDDGCIRQQQATLQGNKRSFLLDGQRSATLGEFATRSPIVVFHPGDLGLVAGPAAGRRTLLDRLVLFSCPMSSVRRSRYQQALRERQALLTQRGRAASETELAAFERIMAEEGAAITRSRGEASALFGLELDLSFRKMATPGLELRVSYCPGGCGDSAAFATELERRRRVDGDRKIATYGPQRDELELLIDGRSARRHASQGQQRILALAIKLAELAFVARARQAHPILLLDDISSELDPERAGAVYSYLRATPSQIFVSTTRPELFETPGLGPGERADFRLEAGAAVRRTALEQGGP